MKKLAFWSFKEIGDLLHVSPKTVTNWSWKRYFKVAGYKTISRGRRIALVNEREVKRLVARFIHSINERGRPGRRSSPGKRRSQHADLMESPTPSWIKESPIQHEREDVVSSSPPEEVMLEKALNGVIEKTSPLEVIKALLQTGGWWTPKEVEEETGLDIVMIKQILIQLEEEGRVEGGITGLWSPDEYHCYTIKENHL